MVVETYGIDIEEILCPICVEHMLGRWICNSQLGFGEKIVPVDGHSGGVVAKTPENYFGEFMVPISLVFKRELFMNRKTFNAKLFTIGSYDDYATYQFKREVFKINEI